MTQREKKSASKRDAVSGRIVVTGGLGFIGAHVFKHVARQKNADVRILDKVTYAADVRRISDSGLDTEKVLMRGDILDARDASRALEGADTVIHLAGETHEPRFFDYPERFFEANAAGTETLVLAALDQGVKHFVHISTSAVYGSGPETDPVSELASLRPVTPYAHSKALAEEAVMLAAQNGLRATILRPGPVIGIGQNPEKPLPRMLIRAMQGRCLPIEGSGQQERSFLPVGDLVAAIDLVMARTPNDALSVFNVAGSEQLSPLDLARLVFEVTGRQTGLEFVHARQPEASPCRIHDGRIRSLGYRQKGTVRAELQAVCDDFRSRTRGLPLRFRLGV
ncbi:NAD-dependent epimerase/dehydratase family protein [Roseibium sp.]|uniref:NAD-dependent epimerase/dehydratase family protein n=1 Tax=Roseibium sp. TaxID=1936156 RepID=UPI003D09F26B